MLQTFLDYVRFGTTSDEASASSPSSTGQLRLAYRIAEELHTLGCTEVEVSTAEGKLGVMARHEPMIAACPPGLMRIRQGGEWVTFRTSRAILVVDREGAVTLLTPLARLAV